MAREAKSKTELLKERRREISFIDQALDSLSDTVFVFDPATGEALRWNKAFREISGYSDEEISVMKGPDSYYSEDDLQKASVATQEVLEGGVATVELGLITKDGRTILTEYQAGLFSRQDTEDKYVIAIGRDITERKRIERELRESEKKWHSLAQNAPNNIMLVDSDGIIQFINHTAHGFPPEDVIGRSVCSFVDSAFHDRVTGL